VSWFDELSSEEFADIDARFDSFNDAAAAAMRNPKYEEKFNSISARLMDADGRLYPALVPGTEKAFARFVVAAHAGAAEKPKHQRRAPRKRTRGSWEKQVSEAEANKVVEIHLRNGELTPWEVFARYARVRNKREPGWMGRHSVEYLIDALTGCPPLLVWDPDAPRNDGELGRLRLASGELWANSGRVIPRRDSAT
jgi:hypothetical protein